MKNKVRRLLKVIYYIFSIIVIVGAYIGFSENYSMYRGDSYRVTNYASTIGATIMFGLGWILFSDLIRRIADYIDNGGFKGFINYKKLNELHYSGLVLLILIITTCFMIGAKQEETCTGARQSREYGTCVCEQGYKLNDGVCELQKKNYYKNGLFFSYTLDMTLGDDHTNNIHPEKISRMDMGKECAYGWEDLSDEEKNEIFESINNAIKGKNLYHCFEEEVLTGYTKKYDGYTKQLVISYYNDGVMHTNLDYKVYLYLNNGDIYRININNKFGDALWQWGDEYGVMLFSKVQYEQSNKSAIFLDYIKEGGEISSYYSSLVKNHKQILEVIKSIKYDKK